MMKDPQNYNPALTPCLFFLIIESYHNGYMDSARVVDKQVSSWSSKHYRIARNVRI